MQTHDKLETFQFLVALDERDDVIYNSLPLLGQCNCVALFVSSGTDNICSHFGQVSGCS